MTFADEQSTTRLEQATHRRCPAFDARQPAQGADTRVDEVEARAVEGSDRVVNLCFDVGNVRLAIPSQVARDAQCGPGEVQSGDLCTEPRQRQRVRPDVTLEMQELEPTHIAQARLVE